MVFQVPRVPGIPIEFDAAIQLINYVRLVYTLSNLVGGREDLRETLTTRFSYLPPPTTYLLLRLTQRLVQNGFDVRLIRQALLSCLLARQFNIVLS